MVSLNSDPSYYYESNSFNCWIGILDLEDIALLKELFWERFYYLLNIISKLWHSLKSLSVFDFDETICHRFDTFQHDIFVENRWDQGNLALLKYRWIEEYIESFYFPWKCSKLMIELIRSRISMILTAWIRDLQLAKVRSVWLWWVPTSVVYSWADKPYELVKIILGLWYIPSRIDVYEDRPEYFLRYAKALSRLFRTDICVHKVKFREDEDDPRLVSTNNYLISK